ncbi:response regulator [Ramlibacter algicola]|uniref:histidine kinase n=1 Tax=Ramlibacter algicola TaxID=2795217 RepID=A0A934URB7_9BURK|nr:response regulator [Ramlibacter algicola]MBK0392362.1 response regulator [Ramlibacter algicola]
MLAAPIPDDEAQRLDDLRRLRVLDTPREDRFDRITRTARRQFGVPIALVSLIGADRQWFKSRQGLDEAETPRNVSFCGHAVLQEGAFIIPDAQADQRFADNPLVTGAPHVRFYAGMPLHGGNGHRVGTLCLIDRAPRTFSADDVAALADLASWAELELNLYSVRQATEVAHDREERLQAIVDNAGDAIVSLTPDGRVETSNPAARRLFGGDGGIGRHVSAWMAGDSREDLLAVMRNGAARSLSGLRQEITCRRDDGSTFPAEVTVTRMGTAAGSGYTLMLRDISDRKQVERMKNEFISTVSHELRTPLTSVRGSLGLVLGGAVGEIAPPAKALLDIAASNCDRLVRLVNDMLDIEKIESGNVRFELVPQPLLPLVKGAIAATEAFAASMGVRYALHEPGSDLRVVVDADRLTQVVVNLLSNAAKFSPAGGCVDVTLSVADARRARIGIGDRGRGIPADFRQRLFSRFGQADASDARARQGTGLGLAISKAIVERLGGSIGFEDRAGGGTEFFVELPLVGEPPRAQGRPGHVLVCEDDLDVARLVCMLLERAGMATDIARSAAEARARLAEHRYRALTLDLGLPDEDGFSLLRWLRARPQTASLPVVVLSARDAPDGTGASAFGALDWLAKPIDEARLLGAVRLALRSGESRRPQVLHVEDDADLAQVVRVMVGGSADTVHAPTLAQAREQLEARDFDLILLDMGLPDGHGSQLLASLPARNAATPVLIFSADEVTADVAAQVNDALVKSRTSSAQLVALLQRLMGVEPGHTEDA